MLTRRIFKITLETCAILCTNKRLQKEKKRNVRMPTDTQVPSSEASEKAIRKDCSKRARSLKLMRQLASDIIALIKEGNDG